MNKSSFRVYYEDTDAGGVVYYANYLKFAERARTEMLRNIGIEQTKLANQEDILFVVRHVEMDLIKPARLDNLLTITTTIKQLSGASIVMSQCISCNDKVLVNINVLIACVSSDMKVSRLPSWVKDKLKIQAMKAD